MTPELADLLRIKIRSWQEQAEIEAEYERPLLRLRPTGAEDNAVALDTWALRLRLWWARHEETTRLGIVVMVFVGLALWRCW